MQHNPLSVRLVNMLSETPKIGQKFRSLLAFSPPELMLLATLARNTADSMTMTEVSELFDISRPAATQLVERLCSKGYLERFRDGEDKRVIRIRLTPQTARCVNAEVERILCRGDRVVERLGEEKTAHLLALLEELRYCINEEIQEEATV